MKKFLSILFATMLAGQAWAANPYYFEYYGLTFNYVSKTEPYIVKVVYKNLEQNYLYSTITIPSHAPDGSGISYTVTEISDNAFKNCSKLTAIEIPNTITSIGSNAA